MKTYTIESTEKVNDDFSDKNEEYSIENNAEPGYKEIFSDFDNSNPQVEAGFIYNY